jgi:protein TonB
MKNNVKGLGTSFILHGAILYTLMSFTPILPGAQVVKVIDFSLISRSVAPGARITARPQAIKAPAALKAAGETREAPVIRKISVPAPGNAEIIPQEKITPKPVFSEQVMTAPPAATLPAGVMTGQMTEEVVAIPPATTEPPGNSREEIKGRYLAANLNYIKENIQQRIIYPRIARRMSWEGKVIVGFVVDEDGTVRDVHVIKSSGHEALDRNAVATIKNGAPYPLPPVRAELVIPVIYRLA